MDLYLPKSERPANDEMTVQYFLSRVLAPQLNKDDGVKDFFNEYYEGKFKKANGKVLGLDPKFKTSFERNIIPGTSNSEIEDYAKSQAQKQKYVDFMLKIKPEQLAAMSPHVQLSILPRKKNGKFEPYKKRKIISFDKKTTLTGYGAMAEFGKGDGVGITKVNVEKKYATANMFDPGIINITYFFQSYQVFAEKVASPLKWHGLTHEDPELRYTELIRPNDFRENNGTLVLEYGWNVADSVSDDIISHDMKGIINDEEKKIYVMGYKSHSFEFADDASITLTVTYFGVGREALRGGNTLTASFGNSSVRSLWLNDLKEMAKANGDIAIYLKRLQEYDDAQDCLKKISKGLGCVQPKFAACGSGKKCDKNKKEVLSLMGQAKNAIQRRYSNVFPVLFERILEDNAGIWQGKYKVDYSFDSEETPNLISAKIGFEASLVGFEDADQLTLSANYNVEEVTKLLKESIIKNPPKGDDLVTEDWSDTLPDISKKVGKILYSTFGATLGAPTQVKGSEKAFKFTTIRDIIMALYRICDDDLRVAGGVSDSGDVAKNSLPYLLLGNIVIPLPDGQKYWYNIGDILVHMTIFNRWLTSVVAKNRSISVGSLITLILRDLVAGILYEGIDSPQRIPINTRVYGYAGSLSWDESQKIIRGNEELLKSRFAGAINNKAANRLIHYHAGPNSFYTNSEVFIPQGTTLFGKDVWNKTRNLDLGYYRVLIGAAEGLLKTVKFTETSNEYYQTLLHLLNSYKTNWLFAPYFYSATLNTFGNNVYQFAGIFNIPAANLGIEKEKDFGLSGFYIIKSVTDTITLDSYDTTITADRVCNLADIDNNIQAKKDKNKAYLSNITFETTANVTLVKQLFNYLSAEKTDMNLYGVKIK